MTSSACTPLCLICDYAILQHESTVLILPHLYALVNHSEQANFTKIFENLFKFIIFYLFLFLFYSFFVYFFDFPVLRCCSRLPSRSLRFRSFFSQPCKICLVAPVECPVARHARMPFPVNTSEQFLIRLPVCAHLLCGIMLNAAPVRTAL